MHRRIEFNDGWTRETISIYIYRYAYNDDRWRTSRTSRKTPFNIRAKGGAEK